MDGRHYWDEAGHPVKYENYGSHDGISRAGGAGGLNFAVGGPPSDDEQDYPPGAYLKKGKVSRQDPMSHRIIEKRRRDRMNNCLADLSRLIPPEYLKKGRGRVEKTEIIEMAIRHLKYLQDRANATDRGGGTEESMGEHFRAGYHECVSEAVRFLVDIQGYAPGDEVCQRLVAHLQTHYDIRTKGPAVPREKPQSAAGSSSETSSSSQSGGYSVPSGVIRHPPPLTSNGNDCYDHDAQQDSTYNMDCDKGDASCSVEDSAVETGSSEPSSHTRHESPVRHHDDYHSYKFKNCIERRFSRSQDSEAHDMSMRTHTKIYTHKRRRAPVKTAASTSTSASGSGSTEEARDHDHLDHIHDNDHLVPVFALNAAGKYYVPVSVEYGCLTRQLPTCALVSRSPHAVPPLHPITLHVNFQPCLQHCPPKSEPPDQDWRPL